MDVIEKPEDKLLRLAKVAQEAANEIEHLRRRIKTAEEEARKHAEEHVEALLGLSIGTKLQRNVKRFGMRAQREERCAVTGVAVTLGIARGEPSFSVQPTAAIIKKDGSVGTRAADRWSLRRWSEEWEVFE